MPDWIETARALAAWEPPPAVTLSLLLQPARGAVIAYLAAGDCCAGVTVVGAPGPDLHGRLDRAAQQVIACVRRQRGIRVHRELAHAQREFEAGMGAFRHLRSAKARR